MSDEADTEMESSRLAQRFGARLRLGRRYKPAIARNLRRFGIAIRLVPLLLENEQPVPTIANAQRTTD